MEKTVSSQLLIGVSGMHCGSCARALETRLAALPGVLAASVNHSLGLARVELQRNDDSTAESCRHTVDAMGYSGYAVDPRLWLDQLNKRRQTLLSQLALGLFIGMWIMLLSVPLYAHVELTAVQSSVLLTALTALTATLLLTVSRSIWQMAWKNLRAGIFGSDLLIVLGHIAALLLSALNLWQGQLEVHFDALLMLCLSQTISRYLEIAQARNRADKLLAGLDKPSQSVLRLGERAGWITVAQIQLGDELHLADAERLPVDARLLQAQACFDVSDVSGESLPQLYREGDAIAAGARLLQSGSRLRALCNYGEAERDRMCLQAMADLCSKPSLQNRLDRWARRWMQLLAAALVLQALLSLAGGAPPLEASRQLAAVLLLGCPCALSLACTLPLFRAADQWHSCGYAPRSLVSIETLAQLNTVVFDKTGTLTELRLTDAAEHRLRHDWSDDSRRWLKTLAAHSRHPQARALMPLLADVMVFEADGAQFQEHLARGVALDLDDGSCLRLGSARWLQRSGVQLIDQCALDDLALALGSTLLGSLQFEQVIDTDTQMMLHRLQAQGLELHLLSGDSEDAVSRFLENLNIRFASVGAAQTPEQKRAVVDALCARDNRVVAMVGDGANDVAASAAADISIGFAHSLGTGMHIDVELQERRGLASLPALIGHAKRVCKRSEYSVLLPAISSLLLLGANTVAAVSPLVIAAVMLINIAGIAILSRVATENID